MGQSGSVLVVVAGNVKDNHRDHSKVTREPLWAGLGRRPCFLSRRIPDPSSQPQFVALVGGPSGPFLVRTPPRPPSGKLQLCLSGPGRESKYEHVDRIRVSSWARGSPVTIWGSRNVTRGEVLCSANSGGARGSAEDQVSRNRRMNSIPARTRRGSTAWTRHRVRDSRRTGVLADATFAMLDQAGSRRSGCGR